MADNEHYYGFRPSQGNAFKGGRSDPPTIECTVATGYGAHEDGGSTIDLNLNIGDPVKRVNDGTIALANTTDAVYGVIAGFGPYWDGSAMWPTNFLPHGHAWGTVESRKPTVYVIPVNACLWEVDVDENSTATSESAYRAFVGENVTHVCPGDSDTLRAEPRLDISLHDTTESLVWRIEAISKTRTNRDFSGANVKLIVSCNVSQDAGQAATNDIGV